MKKLNNIKIKKVVVGGLLFTSLCSGCASKTGKIVENNPLLQDLINKKTIYEEAIESMKDVGIEFLEVKSSNNSWLVDSNTEISYSDFNDDVDVITKLLHNNDYNWKKNFSKDSDFYDSIDRNLYNKFYQIDNYIAKNLYNDYNALTTEYMRISLLESLKDQGIESIKVNNISFIKDEEETNATLNVTINNEDTRDFTVEGSPAYYLLLLRDSYEDITPSENGYFMINNKTGVEQTIQNTNKLLNSSFTINLEENTIRKEFTKEEQAAVIVFAYISVCALGNVKKLNYKKTEEK